MNFKNYILYLVTDEECCKGKDFYESIRKAIQGGVKIVQLREKRMGTRDFYERALKVKKICKDLGAIFIINDRLDIALAVKADGIHLGQSDMPIEIAKEILKDNFIIGITAKTIEQAIEAEKKGADYIGSGAVFSTTTKEGAKKLEIRELKEIVDSINIPVYAIGGINSKNVCELKNIDLQGICSVSGILAEEDCRYAAEQILEKFLN